MKPESSHIDKIEIGRREFLAGIAGALVLGAHDALVISEFFENLKKHNKEAFKALEKTAELVKKNLADCQEQIPEILKILERGTDKNTNQAHLRKAMSLLDELERSKENLERGFDNITKSLDKQMHNQPQDVRINYLSWREQKRFLIESAGKKRSEYDESLQLFMRSQDNQEQTPSPVFIPPLDSPIIE